VLTQILIHVLGQLAASIQAEILLDQKRPRSSAGPSPDIMGLKGLRLAFASETDEGQRFSPAKVKWLTGGGQLVGRNPHDKYEIRFIPTHTLILLTNHKPQAPADDFAFWERLHLVPFRLSFVNRNPLASTERRAQKDLVDQLKGEASGILAWLVRGCLIYQKRGLDPPKSIVEATAEYRRDEDLLAQFLEDECFIEDHAQVNATDLYDCFADWFERNISKNVMKQKRFGTMITRRFEKRRLSGSVQYFGLRLKPPNVSGV
jgi:putative DNA primase/helicase